LQGKLLKKATYQGFGLSRLARKAVKKATYQGLGLSRLARKAVKKATYQSPQTSKSQSLTAAALDRCTLSPEVMQK
jgi:hypothetical protein